MTGLKNNIDEKQSHGFSDLGPDATIAPNFSSETAPSTPEKPKKTLASLAHDHANHQLDRVPDGKYPSRLAAERVFDASVYGIWNYVIQAGTSVAAATHFTEGAGRPHFDKAAEWLGKNVVEKVSNKVGEAAVKETHTPLIFVSLIMVGNLFIPPMRYAEQHKAHYVSKINDWLNHRREANGDAPDAEELAYQQRAIKRIAEEPIQTNASLWGGRAAGMLANIAAGIAVGEERNLKMKNAFAAGVSKGLATIGAHGMAESPNVKALSRNAFLDYGYSIIGANVIYIYSHYINPPKAKASDLEEASHSDAVAQPTATIHPAVIQQSANHQHNNQLHVGGIA